MEVMHSSSVYVARDRNYGNFVDMLRSLEKDATQANSRNLLDPQGML